MKLQLGNDKGSLAHDYIWVRNNGSAAIDEGAPAIFEMDGSEDNLSAENASDSSAAGAGTVLAGIALESIAVGALGKVKVRGYIDKVKVVRMTRAATTDAWASYPAIAKYDQLIVNTVANAMSRSGAGAATAANPLAVVLGTAASATTQASSLAAWTGQLAITATFEGFLRIM